MRKGARWLIRERTRRYAELVAAVPGSGGLSEACLPSVTIEEARRRGLTITHSLSFTDNTSAESVFENGKPQSDGLHAVNLLRQQTMAMLGVHQKHERVTSEDNVLADLLSRGDIEEALRFAEETGMTAELIVLTPRQRSLEGIPPTWPSPQGQSQRS